MGRLLVIDDNESIREGVQVVAVRAGHDVEVADSGVRGLEAFDGQAFDLVLTDLKMDQVDGIHVLEHVKAKRPDTAVVIMTAYGTIENAVEAMKLGAFDYVQKPFSPSDLRMRIDRALEWRRLQQAQDKLTGTQRILTQPTFDEDGTFMGMVGTSPRMTTVFNLIEKVAPSETNVHIFGESGTGKELVASAIHRLSSRADGPLITVNCGAMPETLIESELFGHEKGAFTGAAKRKLGRFELADGGTIFLDEVGELSPAVQVKLLRVLQEKSFDRVGGEQPVHVDVRIISATNRDLRADVESGRFRQDLFFRLHVIPIDLPPLRERTDDIPALARFFMNKLRGRTHSSVSRFTPEAMGLLRAYRYPGNVRELENIVEQALVFADPPEIRPSDLPPQVTGNQPHAGRSIPIPSGDVGLNEFLEAAERQMILAAYEAADGVKTETARRLKIKTSALYYKLEKYGIGTVAGRPAGTSDK
ncbi:MAG: sigma-54-dependent transcriptional regulator [Myxococcota bacterium]